MSQTVIGFFDDASDVQRAVERLERKGISRDRIDISRGSSSSTDTTTDTRTVSDDRVTSEGRTVDKEGRNTNAITDFFNSLFGGKDDDADRYSRVAQRSNSIVTVHAQSKEEAEAAAEILDDCGAVDVDERAAQYGYGNTRSGDSMGDRSHVAADRDRSNTIERIEENLEVGKRDVENGGVRVRSRIVERPVEEKVRLREEHVHIERNPVDRPVSGLDEGRLQDRDIEMRERSEVPVVNKEARVVEEIRLSKDVDEREETIRENVRHTEVDIDNDIDRGTTNRNSLDTDDDYSDNDRPGRAL
mgnify:CR=1 FL=1